MTAESEAAPIDLMNRDPDGMNAYVHLQFNDVFAEPTSTHSKDCVWANSFKCFNCSKALCYNILTFFCGLILACSWGCIFAEIAFGIIWVVGPMLRALNIVMHPLKKILQIMLSSILGPIVEVHSLIFSRIHVTMAQGQPPKPLGQIDGDKNAV